MIPKPQLRRCWGGFLTEPRFGLTSIMFWQHKHVQKDKKKTLPHINHQGRIILASCDFATYYLMKALECLKCSSYITAHKMGSPRRLTGLRWFSAGSLPKKNLVVLQPSAKNPQNKRMHDFCHARFSIHLLGHDFPNLAQIRVAFVSRPSEGYICPFHED